MLLFNEGLPGAGKSYDAIVNHILVALRAGRKVFAYVDGLNRVAFAQELETTVDRIAELLIPISEDQVREIWKHVEDNSLVVIDELQNFWPTGREKQSEDITRFVAEHRHRGLDILCMGQDLRDCHALWKRRVSQKVVFTKLDGLGMGGRYSWRLYKAVKGEKFQIVNSGTGKYEERYFPLYKSHVAEDIQTGNYKDRRATIWASKGFRFGLPAIVLIAIFAINYLFRFLHGDVAVTNVSIAEANRGTGAKSWTASNSSPRKALASATSPPSRTAVASQKPAKPPPLDYFDAMTRKGRLRLSAFVVSDEDPDKYEGLIDILDGGYHVIERFRVAELRALGWQVKHEVYGLQISRGKVLHIAHAWPLDVWGRVSENVKQSPEITGKR